MIIIVSTQLLSATTVNINPLARERHISFAVPRENDSSGSNHTAIAMNGDDYLTVADGYSTSGTKKSVELNPFIDIHLHAYVLSFQYFQQ